MKTIKIIALVLTIIGALNWGMVGLFDLNLVDAIFGVRNIVSIIIYCLVGLSGFIDIAILSDLIED